MKKRIIAAVAVFGLLGGILYFAYAQTAAQNNVKHFTAFFAVEGEAIDQNNDMKKEIARLTGADCEELWLVGQSKESALNSYIVSGEYPDFISGDTSLYEAGALLPLDEYWENYPNIKNYLTEEQWERFRRPDGHIYWIPQFGVNHGEDVEVTHSGEAFWIQTRVLKWAGYPEIHTVDEYFDLIERYVAANPVMEDGTPNIPFTILCDGWRYFCLENIPQFLDGYPNDGSCIVDPDTLQVYDYNTTDTAKWYFKKLNEEYHKDILGAEVFTETYEDYLAFHKKYYHPSNSYLYLYGNMDMEEKLNWIDENYLSHFEKIEVDSEVRLQKPFAERKEEYGFYSVTEGEDTEGKAYFSYNTVCGDGLDRNLYRAFPVLSYVLVQSIGAPLKQALLDAGIGNDISCYYEESVRQPFFSIIAKNVKMEQKQQFINVIETELKKIVKEGLNQQSLLALSLIHI